jgi:hypothetical protein
MKTMCEMETVQRPTIGCGCAGYPFLKKQSLLVLNKRLTERCSNVGISLISGCCKGNFKVYLFLLWKIMNFWTWFLKTKVLNADESVFCCQETFNVLHLISTILIILMHYFQYIKVVGSMEKAFAFWWRVIREGFCGDFWADDIW